MKCQRQGCDNDLPQRDDNYGSNRRFCSTQCRLIDTRERLNAKLVEQRGYGLGETGKKVVQCRQCGADMLLTVKGNKGTSKKYCSAGCIKAAATANRAAYFQKTYSRKQEETGRATTCQCCGDQTTVIWCPPRARWECNECWLEIVSGIIPENIPEYHTEIESNDHSNFRTEDEPGQQTALRVWEDCATIDDIQLLEGTR